MAIEYRVDEVRQLVFVHAAGRLSDEMLIDHTAELHRDPDHSPGLDEIFDAREVDDFALTSRGIRGSAEIMRHKEGDPAARLAIVVNSDVSFGMGRMYELSRGDIDVQVFRSLEDAMSWLGVD